jgi:hypothetical protein
MQEANLRSLDIRHTLPNLKALLLTLSSPVPLHPPAPLPRRNGNGNSISIQTGLGYSNDYSSRDTSRQTSNAWSIPRGIRSPTSASVISSLGDIGSPTKVSSGSILRERERDRERGIGGLNDHTGVLGRNVGVAGGGAGSRIGTPSPLKVERRSKVSHSTGRGGMDLRDGPVLVASDARAGEEADGSISQSDEDGD